MWFLELLSHLFCLIQLSLKKTWEDCTRIGFMRFYPWNLTLPVVLTIGYLLILWRTYLTLLERFQMTLHLFSGKRCEDNLEIRNHPPVTCNKGKKDLDGSTVAETLKMHRAGEFHLCRAVDLRMKGGSIEPQQIPLHFCEIMTVKY